MDVTEHAKYGRLFRAIAHLVRDHAFENKCILYRLAKYDYSNSSDFLSGQGTLKGGTRYGAAKTFPIVYGSTDPHLALDETCQQYKNYHISPHPPILDHRICTFECSLTVTLDLRAPEIRKALGVTIKTLSEESWSKERDAGKESLTQAIGRAAHANEVQALLVPSRFSNTEHNVAIFPDKLDGKASYLELKELTGTSEISEMSFRIL